MGERGWVKSSAGAWLLVLLVGQGCVATTSVPPARAILVAGPPPAPIVEVRPPRTQPLATWIEGYWHWSGIQYAWIPGHWEVAPGRVWRAPRYVKTEGAYLYEPGTWGASPEAPSPNANAFH